MLHSTDGSVQADTLFLVLLVTRIILLHPIIIVIMDGFFLELLAPIHTMHSALHIIHVLLVGPYQVKLAYLPMVQLVQPITHVHLVVH